MKAKAIYTNGEVKDIEPANGTDFQLHELKTVINGYCEIVCAADRKHYIVCDEEGLLKNLKPNIIASSLAGQLIVGDVIYCDISQIQ